MDNNAKTGSEGFFFVLTPNYAFFFSIMKLVRNFHSCCSLNNSPTNVRFAVSLLYKTPISTSVVNENENVC